MKKPQTLINQYRNATKDAKKSVIEIMRMKNLETIYFALDNEGRNYFDPDYEIDDVYDSYDFIWTTCYGKHENCDGFVTSVSLDKNDPNTLHISAFCYDLDCEFDEYSIDTDCILDIYDDVYKRYYKA